MKEKDVREISIEKLISEMNHNAICLPDFQREFVWSPDQMAKLIESVVRHYPIGTFLLLNAKMNPDIERRSFHGPDDKTTRDAKYLVVDGQQRLRTFLCLLDTPSKFQTLEPFEYSGRKYKIYLKVTINPSKKLPKEVDKPHFVLPRKTEEDDKDDFDAQGKLKLMPIEFIRNAKFTNRWIQKALTRCKSRTKRRFVANIKAIKKLIDSYECAVEVINTKPKPLDLANMFTLLNEAGTDLTTFDLLTATLSPHGVRLRKLWAESQNKYPLLSSRQFDIDPVYVLKVVSLIKQTVANEPSPTCTRRDLRTIHAYYKGAVGGNEFKKDWFQSCKYISSALEELKSKFGVVNKKWIPYSPMVVVLAAIRWWINEYKKYSERYKATIDDKLRNWYWGSIFNRAYEARTDDVISKHYCALRKWLVPGGRQKIPSEINYFLSKKQITEAIDNIESGGDARYKAILCLPFVDKRAYDIYSHDCLENAIVHDHHIFPKAYLRELKVENREINHVINRMLITDKTNQEIKRRKPYDYLHDVERNILKKHFLMSEIVDKKLNFSEFVKKRQILIADYLWRLINK